MVLTPSTMQELGSAAPDFSLPTPTGELYTLSEQSLKNGVLVIFMCNHCPYVIHIREKLASEIRLYQNLGITVVGINSNDFKSYPDDSPEQMARIAAECTYSFPFLVDESQEVAKAYRAACTPDFFLYNAKRTLVYRGQFDAARPGNQVTVTGEDLSKAIDALINNTPISLNQTPSMGCNIKWKSGNEPGYF